MRALWLLGLAGLVGCANSSGSTLALRQVVLYRSGMGYFEHTGRLADSHLRLRLRQGEIDDVMKTIAVMSTDDGAVVGAVAALKARGADGDVDFELSVASRRDITVSFAVPTPTWRSTHKLVLGEGDTGLLQTWAIIDNATDEDWRGVRLTLATGAPLSFAVDLHTAQFIARPDASGHLVQPAATGVIKSEHGRSDGEDADGDGIPDGRDLCPQQAEDKDGFEDDDGCPDPDNDKDRIPDAQDKCPNEPETYNGFEDDDGCPDRGRVILRSDKLEILDKLYFDNGKYSIKPVAEPLLDAIAATLNGNPQLLSIEIGGHAAAREVEPVDLSSARAAAVRAALVARNVAGGRFHLRGYGTAGPACREASEACWSKNRRVEFTILQRREEEPAVAEAPTAPSVPAPPSAPVKPTLPAAERAFRAAPTVSAEVAGMIRYEIQTPVSVPARSSAMVAIQNRRLPGMEIYLYRPDPAAPGTDRHPFRAARFECPAGQEMEAGPLAIYARGTYVGDAVLDRLHPGEVSFVPFAVDGTSTIDVSFEDSQVPLRLVKIEHGVLTVEDRRVHRTIYEVAASDTAPSRIVVQHDDPPGYRPTSLPTGSIDVGHGHLVPFALRASVKTTLQLDDEKPARREVRPLLGQAIDLEPYLRGTPKVPGPIADQLRRAGKVHTAMREVEAEIEQLRRRMNDSSRRMNEVRENLGAIEKNPAAEKLRRELTGRLTLAIRAHEELDKQLAQLTVSSQETYVQLRALLQDLDLEEQSAP